eukprot:gene19007-24826_t
MLAQSLEVQGLQSLPSNWFIANANLNNDQIVKLRIALVPKDSTLLEKSLIEIATPGTSMFRKYLSKDEITSIVGRSDEDISRVSTWLNQAGVNEVSIHPHRDWLFASTTVGIAQKLFQCTLAEFGNSKNGRRKLAAWGSYHIPDMLSDVISMVAGMSTLPSGRLESVHVPVSESDPLTATSPVTPSTIYSIYASDSTGSHGSKLGSQAVVEFGTLANFNEADTQTFFTKYQANLTGEVVGVVYGSNNGNIRPSVEANLDVQYIMTTGVFVNTSDYKITGGLDIEDEFLDYTILVNSENSPPLVHSISYGEYGGSYDNTTDQRFSYELQKMGISGVSVLLASGDNGVGCNSDGSSQEFDYPSSPYITMVGATYLDLATGTEIGATLSSGGFSLDFYQASWQTEQVEAYFNSGVSLPSEYYFPQGRAYPDVAAFGQNVLVVASGSSEAVSGTSCSAPIFAGLVALVNHELLSKGEAPLGFLNPWLYAYPEMFTDITSGSNPYQLCSGFQAAEGWDPVTGLGTPIYPKLVEKAFEALEVVRK